MRGGEIQLATYYLPACCAHCFLLASCKAILSATNLGRCKGTINCCYVLLTNACDLDDCCSVGVGAPPLLLAFAAAYWAMVALFDWLTVVCAAAAAGTRALAAMVAIMIILVVVIIGHH